MNFKSTEILNPTEKIQILNLWNKEYPFNIQLSDLSELESYLANLKDKRYILVQSSDGEVIAWYMDFIRDEERWFAMIVGGRFQGKGLGGKLLQLGKEQNTELNGWAIQENDYKKGNGEWYTSPIPFYRKNKFEILSNVKLETKYLTAIKIYWEKKAGN